MGVHRLFGMRVWLAAAFAGVAALTAIAVVGVLNQRTDRAYRNYGETFAVGNAVSAAESLKSAADLTALRRRATSISSTRRTAIFALGRRGRLLTPPVSNRVSWTDVPHRAEAVHTALGGQRYIAASHDGSAIVVGLKVHGGAAHALVTYSQRPELRTQLGLVQHTFAQSAFIAFIVGAVAGAMIATLTGRRLARIAGVAHAIGEGDFSPTRIDRFPDEVGSLSSSIDRMRGQLRELFEALSNDRDRLERLLDRLDEGVLLVDRDFTIEFANERAHELLDLDDGLGATMPADRASAEALGTFVRELFDQNSADQIRLTPDGVRVLRVSGIAPNTVTEAAIVIVSDESQRERNEQAQREFAANAAHELKTPLASIIVAIEMLQTGAKEDIAARDEFLDTIELEAARLSRLTRALLVLARAEAREELPPTVAVRLRRVLDQVASGLPRDHAISVRVECNDDLLAAGDSDLLEEAVWNLAINAVGNTESGEVVLRAFPGAGGKVVIEIADTGHGIDVKDRPRIFERFYRPPGGQPGFGLGLSIARAAVHALRGEIELESAPGQGTTVTILIPIAHAVEAV